MFQRARARYLVAIGIPALSAIACSKTPDIGPAGSASAGNALEAPVDDAAAAAEGGLTAVPMPPGRRPSFPPCPHGAFCTSDPAPADAGAAPDPYASCAQSRPLPDGTEVGASRRLTVRFDPTATADKRTSDANACCYTWNVLCAGGRALRVDGVAATARSARRDDWRARLAHPGADELSRADKERCSAHWAREASFEHASIASFARVSLELLAAGAPPELVAATHRAALDEIEHARIAYALASRYGGEPVGPGPLPSANQGIAPRPLSELAAETLRDGCAGEASAAMELREAAARARDPELSAALLEIAEDEDRHAELAFRTLKWALDAGGASVRERILGEMGSLRRSMEAKGPWAPDDERLCDRGILGRSTRAHIRARTLAEVVLPCLEALLSAA